MTDDKKQKLQQRMDALHEKYCKQLPEKYQEIESCWLPLVLLNKLMCVLKFRSYSQTLKKIIRH